MKTPAEFAIELYAYINFICGEDIAEKVKPKILEYFTKMFTEVLVQDAKAAWAEKAKSLLEDLKNEQYDSISMVDAAAQILSEYPT